MSSQFKGRMGELYAEFEPILNKLDTKDLLWLILFVNGYHAGNAECLALVCPDRVFEEIRSEAIYMTHDTRRQTPNNNRKRKLKSAYTAEDYIEGMNSPEDALIAFIDSFNLTQEFN